MPTNGKVDKKSVTYVHNRTQVLYINTHTHTGSGGVLRQVLTM